MKCSIIILLVASISWIAAMPSEPKETIPSDVKEYEASDQRLINGIIATQGDTPFHVYIRAQTNLAKSTYCGGSLLVNNWVLTSASCLSGAVTATVSFGAFDRMQFNEAGRVNRQINAVNFEIPDDLPGNPDIALIRVIPPIDNSVFISPVAYANDPDESYNNLLAVIYGWGRFLVDSGERSSFLRYALATVHPDTECAPLAATESEYFCVSASDSREIAYGDTGSPAVVFNANGAPSVIGVATFVPNTRDDSFSAYTSVAPYASWITAVLST